MRKPLFGATNTGAGVASRSASCFSEPVADERRDMAANGVIPANFSDLACCIYYLQDFSSTVS